MPPTALEDRLRTAMQARAADVTPSPRLRAQINARIDRAERRPRLVVGGIATAVAALVAVAVVVQPWGATDDVRLDPSTAIASDVDPDAPARPATPSAAPTAPAVPADAPEGPADPPDAAATDPSDPTDLPADAGTTIDLRGGGRAELTGTLAGGEEARFILIVEPGDLFIDADGDGTRPGVAELTVTVDDVERFTDVTSATARIEREGTVLVVVTGLADEPTAFAGAAQLVPLDDVAGDTPPQADDAVDPQVLAEGEYAQGLRVALDGQQVLVNTTCRTDAGSIRMNVRQEQDVVVEVDEGGTAVQLRRDGASTLSEATTVRAVDGGREVRAPLPDGNPTGFDEVVLVLPDAGEPAAC